MTIRREDVERVVRLAALAVDDDALPALTKQIAGILEYVSQLEKLDLPVEGAVWLGKTPPQPPRADEVQSPDLQRPLKTLAPSFREGLFLVPKLLGLEDE